MTNRQFKALITKYFMERGAEEVDAFKELANSLSLQHRGQTDHSQYIKPSCQRMPASSAGDKANPVDRRLDGGGGQDRRVCDKHNRLKGDKRVDSDELGKKQKHISRAPTSNSEVGGCGPLQNGVGNLQARTNQPIIDDSTSPKQERREQSLVLNVPFSKEHVTGQRRDSRASAADGNRPKPQDGGIPPKFGNISLFVCSQKTFPGAH